MLGIKLLGLCGRAGAGKSTVAEYLAPAKKPILTKYTNPWAYILSVLYGWNYTHLNLFIPTNKDITITRLGCLLGSDNMPKDPIWNRTVSEAFEVTYSALQKLHPRIEQYVRFEFDAPIPMDNDKTTWVQIGFADPLKRICVPLCGLNYDILLGLESDKRAQRERPIREFVPDFWHPTMSGRELLEFVGTDVMRAVDDSIWISIAKRSILDYHANNIRVVISDVRFKNEAEMIRNAGGSLFILSRQPSDLSLTDEDRKTHVSKWEFLTFINQRDFIIMNSSTIHNLQQTVDKLLSLDYL